jgi:hypothetical protein
MVPVLPEDHPPEDHQEDQDTIIDPDPKDLGESCLAVDVPRTFEIVNKATTRGGLKLIDNLGYTYIVKRRRCKGEVVDWQCTIRRKGTSRCSATVTQRPSQMFSVGPRQMKFCFKRV